METRVCPGCESAFYALNDLGYTACPYCGLVLWDRRANVRFKGSAKLTFSCTGETGTAEVVDYSQGGVKIAYTGKALPKGRLITVDIKALNIHTRAKTVWTAKGRGKKLLAGLKLLRGPTSL